jgi:hypothetical protein
VLCARAAGGDEVLGAWPTPVRLVREREGGPRPGYSPAAKAWAGLPGDAAAAWCSLPRFRLAHHRCADGYGVAGPREPLTIDGDSAAADQLRNRMVVVTSTVDPPSRRLIVTVVLLLLVGYSSWRGCGEDSKTGTV